MVDLDALPLVFTRSGALSVGLRRARFERLIRNGELVVVAPGRFAAAVRWATSDAGERHLALATAACPAFDHSALSHVSAALWWGLPTPRVVPLQPALTVHRGRRPSDDSDWVRVLRCELPERHVVTRGTVRVTSPARTVVDCFRSLPLADALAIADAAVRRGLTPVELVEVRKEQARWPGIRSARRGIGLVDGRRESWLESASVAGLDGWSLPHPSPQVEVRDELGDLIGRVDLYWRGLRVVGEADGRGKFRGEFDRDTSERAVADRLIAAEVRAGRLRETGVGVVRWGPATCADPTSSLPGSVEQPPRGRFARPSRADRASRTWTTASALPDSVCQIAPAMPPERRVGDTLTDEVGEGRGVGSGRSGEVDRHVAGAAGVALDRAPLERRLLHAAPPLRVPDDDP